MTFKHLKFEDSPVMRSLEKVAIEKGLVSPQFMIKQAEKKSDFSVSINLSENIIKLCNGLRSCGLEAKADELEKNYLDYKKAQTLYETSKETGEDLVHSAHPKGSHKLEGVEGDSIIETIIDQHLQHLRMIEKKPTGKLSTASIIDKVKIILAQDATLESQLLANMSKLVNIMQRLRLHAENEISMAGSFGWNVYQEKINTAASNPTIDNINTAKSYFNRLYSRLEPGLIQGVSEDTWSVIKPLFGSANSIIEKSLVLRQKINEERAREAAGGLDISDKPERTGVTVVDVYGLATAIKSALSTLNGYRAAINTDDTLEESDKNSALAWINGKANAINNIKAQYDGLENDEEKMAAAPRMLENLKKITAKFNQFHQDWIANA